MFLATPSMKPIANQGEGSTLKCPWPARLSLWSAIMTPHEGHQMTPPSSRREAGKATVSSLLPARGSCTPARAVSTPALHCPGPWGPAPRCQQLPASQKHVHLLVHSGLAVVCCDSVGVGGSLVCAWLKALPRLCAGVRPSPLVPSQPSWLLVSGEDGIFFYLFFYPAPSTADHCSL